MKELTIEQKAKAYDEAAERALKLKVQNPFDTVGQMMEYIFPELAESDDEKIRKEILDYIDKATGCKRWVAWLEKQGECETDCHRSHQDANHPNGCIVLEDFNGGEGFYKVHLDYLSKKQVEVVEEMVRTWNNDSKVPDEDIKSCIGMCLTDAHEQRFKDYNTSLKDCLAWLEKQGEQKPADKVEPKFKVGDKIRRKAPSSCDKDMQVARIEEDYYSQRYKLYMWGLPLYKP